MITYYNRTRMTAVPTELLQDTHLSVEAKGFAAILYAFDEGFELSELACQLNMPEERISVVLERFLLTLVLYRKRPVEPFPFLCYNYNKKNATEVFP